MIFEDKRYMQHTKAKLVGYTQPVKEFKEQFSDIKDLVEAVKQVTESRTYSLCDEVKAYGKNCKIVEVLDEGRFHLKNLQEPCDSFVAVVEEFE